MEFSPVIAIVISAAAFLTSIAGPFLTAHIQCKHEQKMYHKRFRIEHEHEVIERYLKTAGKYCFSLDYNDMRDFGEASAEIFMYAPKELWDDIKALNTQISVISRVGDYDKSKQLRTQLQESYLSLCENFSVLRRTSERK
ncbi:MAG: hypothetical protein IJ002_03040 [Clostridia bacterium]|nr:hypothetical protein [Clostridia bacterium]MBQ8836467.1 hypothetical protein [Clostridia bacterium]